MNGLDASARLRVRIGGLAAALLAALLVLLAGSAIRQPLFDLFQRVTPAPTASPRLQVVLIDAPSLAAVGGWPWSRYALARLTEQIAVRGAAAIGFDFLFPEPDRLSPTLFAGLYPELSPAATVEVQNLPSMDAVFARVIGRAPVVLAHAGVMSTSFDALASGAAPLASDVPFTGPVPTGGLKFAQTVSNLPILEGAALGHGLVNGPPDEDGVTRRVPVVAMLAGSPAPGFALELVRVAEDADHVELLGQPGHLEAVKVGRHRVPVESDGRLVVRYANLPGKAMTSAADLLRKGIPDDAFKGKIVLVGLTAAGTSDVVTTPTATETYGVFVQAQAVDAILRGDALRRPSWATALEWGLSLLLILAAWQVVPRLGLRAIIALVAGAGVLALAGSWFAFSRGLLLDPAPVLAPGAAAAAMIGLLFVEGNRLQDRLKAALDLERLGAAKYAGELAAASEIQSGMLLPREALMHITPDVEIDEVLQPARSVGGDLYDAFMMDEHRLCFLVGDVTGKGVPASLFMALSKALSRSLLMRPRTDLATAVDGINAELSRDNGQAMAVSLLVGVLDLADGSLDLCCAGHENPLVVDAAGGVRELRLDGGPALCVAEGFPYPVERHRLEPGETIVAYTDGVTEAQSPDEELFGRDRAMAAVAGLAAARSLAEVIDTLVAAVRAFEAGEEPSDDLTVLALRRRG